MERRKLLLTIGGVLFMSLVTINIAVLAADNPCNPAPTQDPNGKAVMIDCTYGNITYKNMECCNDVYPNPPFHCEGWYQTCPEPIPPE